MEADAKAYRDRVIASAEGESARFLSVLAEYTKAPEVTRERLYLETMERVLSNTNKVLMDIGAGGNSLVYLPLDQIVNKKADGTPPKAQAAPAASAAAPEQAQPSKRDGRDTSRERKDR